MVWNVCALSILFSCAFFTWRSTNKGLHPSFLFQIFLILFQGGRLISFFLSGCNKIIWIVNLYSEPVYLSITTIKISILLFSISSYIIYVTAIVKIPVIKIPQAVINSNIFFFVFLTTIPFYIFKNITYLYYIFTHGGYLSIYIDNGEHLESVGIIVRFFANICFSSYLLYIFHEKDLKRVKYIMVFFLLLSSLELFIGLRGKYFDFFLLNVLMYRQKIIKGFKVSYLLFIGAFVIFSSVFISFFRESKEFESESLISNFFYGQGASSTITMLAVEKYNIFHPHSFNYIFNGLLLSFRHQNSFGPGSALANDFTNYLSPNAFDLGFGTGTTYLAELYLVYGIPTVVLGTFIVGIFLSLSKNYTQGLLGTLSFIFVMGCVYLPRTSLLEPFGEMIKYGITCCTVYFFCTVYVLLINKRIKFHS